MPLILSLVCTTKLVRQINHELLVTVQKGWGPPAPHHRELPSTLPLVNGVSLLQLQLCPILESPQQQLT